MPGGSRLSWSETPRAFPALNEGCVVNVDGVDSTGLICGTNPMPTVLSFSGYGQGSTVGAETEIVIWIWSSGATLAQRTNLCHNSAQPFYGAGNFGASC